nr:nucleoid-associated protein [Rhodocyclus gracilis]
MSQSQRDSLEILDFIFHIIELDAGKEEKVEFLDEVSLQPKQKKFFLARLQDILEGTQYVFKPDAVHLKEKCQQLVAERHNLNVISRQIATDFADRHRNQMAEGVFVVAVVRFLASANEWKKLILLVKMDKSASFSYSRKVEGGRKIAVMTDNPNALSETKSSIQKSAVIDADSYFAWDVLAYDRKTKPRLTDYFKGFLGVTERQQDAELTRATHFAVKKWARGLDKDAIPPGEDAAGYIGRAQNYLKDHDTFETDEFINAVVKDEDPARKQAMSGQLREALAAAGVAGQQFTPRPGSLRPAECKQHYLTSEGVTITFEGDKEAVGLKTETLPDGRERITIETRKLTLKN